MSQNSAQAGDGAHEAGNVINFSPIIKLSSDNDGGAAGYGTYPPAGYSASGAMGTGYGGAAAPSAWSTGGAYTYSQV